jgi:hypothetical protein
VLASTLLAELNSRSGAGKKATGANDTDFSNARREKTFPKGGWDI